MDAEQHIAGQGNPEAMLRLRGLLAAWFGADITAQDWSVQDWNDVLVVAMKSKTIGFVLGGCEKAGITVPDEIAVRLKNIRAAITQKNQINFAWTLRATKILEGAHIDVLAFKGPLRTRGVYKNWSSRGSTDIDLLVRPRDYDAALAALRKSDYHSLVSEQSRWWRDCLGELPMARKDGAGPIVDLHHQVQQPGGPYPKDFEALFSTSERQVQSQATYRVPNRDVARLITAICYGKAVRDDSAWAHHAHELLVESDQMSPAEREAFALVAKDQGLSRLYDEALSNARRLYRIDQDMSEGGPEDIALLRSAIGTPSHRPLFRTRRLWRWIDGGLISRTAKITAELWNVLRSEMVRLREQRSGKLDAISTQ